MDDLFRTTDAKSAAYALYAFGAKILKVETTTTDHRGPRLHFVLAGVPPGARLAPAEGELVDLGRYLRAFENAKAALTAASRGAR